jgi:hypothetical protein
VTPDGTRPIHRFFREHWTPRPALRGRWEAVLIGLDLWAQLDPYTLVQSNAHGKRLRTPLEALSQEAQDRLRELMESLDPLGKLAAKTRGTQEGPSERKHQPSRRDIRLPQPGDLLRRVYQGRPITVRVLESGFEYEGRRFRSLSAIAKAVTGAHWNGLLFFGITRQER